MHLFKNFALLTANLKSHFKAEARKFIPQFFKRLFRERSIHYHHHIKIILDDGLRNVKNVNVVLCKIRARLGENADGVLADYSYYCLFHFNTSVLKFPLVADILLRAYTIFRNDPASQLLDQKVYSGFH